MKHRGMVPRVWKKEGGERRWVMIELVRCPECRKGHRALPDFLTPYKHYETETIEDVIDEVITEDDPIDYPCNITMRRWRGWFERNRANVEGQIRSAAYRLLDLSTEFLKSTGSLLEELRERISPGWLCTVERVIYNSGSRIIPYPLLE